MAPRAGFEISRKLLKMHVDTGWDELSTPFDTPLRHVLRK